MKKVDGGSKAPLFFFSFSFFFFNAEWFLFYMKREILALCKESSNCPSNWACLKLSPLSIRDAFSRAEPWVCLFDLRVLFLYGWQKRCPEHIFALAEVKQRDEIPLLESRECVFAKSAGLLWLSSQATNHEWRKSKQTLKHSWIHSS